MLDRRGHHWLTAGSQAPQSGGEVPREWQDRNWVPVTLFRPNTLWAALALPTHLKSRVRWLPERSRRSRGEDGGQRSQSDVYKSNRESCKCSGSPHGKENEVSDLYGAANHVGQRRQEEQSRRACRRPGAQHPLSEGIWPALSVHTRLPSHGGSYGADTTPSPYRACVCGPRA